MGVPGLRNAEAARRYIEECMRLEKESKEREHIDKISEVYENGAYLAAV